MPANPQLSLKVKIFPGYTPATYTPTLVGTDVTSYVRLEEVLSFNRGAQDETSFPSSGRCTFVLNNRDYRFTPDNTASPLFPNVKNKMPVRVERAATSSVSVSAITANAKREILTVPVGHGVVMGQYVTVAGASNAGNNGTFVCVSVTSTTITLDNASAVSEPTTSATAVANVVVWTGFVETIEEHWNSGVQPTVVVSASDYFSTYARQSLPSTITAQQLEDAALALYPLADQTGSTSSADASGNGNGALRRRTYGTTSTTTVQTQNFGPGQFGSDPDSNALQLFRHSTAVGYYMGANLALAADATGTLEGYFYLSNGAMNGVLMRIETASTGYAVNVTTGSVSTMVSTVLETNVATTRITGATLIDDYAWHHVALTWSRVSTTTTWTLYVDGVSQGTWAETGSVSPAIVGLFVGGADGALPCTLWAANVAIYGYVLGSTVLTDHASAVGGFVESSSARFARIMTLAGASYSTASSAYPAATKMGPQPTSGVNLLDVLQQINDAEDGAIYLDARGVTQYVSQQDRDTQVAAIAVDPKYISPATTIMRAPATVNQVIATRAGAGSVTAQDATSIAENGVMTESISLYVSNDDDLQTVARRRFFRRAAQQPRIGNVVVDLTTATAVNDALLGADVGTYLQIGPLPRGAVDTLTVRIEGIADSITPTSWTRTFVTSPAYRSKSGTSWVLGTSTLDYTTTLA